MNEPTGAHRQLSRRRLLGAVGIGAGGLAIGGVGGAVADARLSDRSDSSGRGLVPFHGLHQAGIATPAQNRLLFASFDLTTTKRSDVAQLLRDWTAAAERLTTGLLVSETPSAMSPPGDTGEAMDEVPANLTLTFGFGPTLFSGTRGDRFGLASQRPAALADIPAFPGDLLDPARSGGDLCVQACGDDPQVLFHAIRNLARIGRGTVVIRWVQEGFGRTSSTTTAQSTPRNLMGFKDGTDNLRADESDFAEQVWVGGADQPQWMQDGSYLVARRIRILIEVWDRSTLADQEATFGRHRDTGAPLGSDTEFTPLDLGARDRSGALLIPVSAHVAAANQNALEIHLLRRGYNYTDGLDPRIGQLDAGLFFLAYQRDPRTQFVPMQDRLARTDALNEYIKHVGSAVFAVPPGISRGGWIGETLLG
jgi:deferrochelatase/peroxidase EfeB